MDIADKTRLLKIIGMLGSSFEGERANAAAMIGAMAEKYKLTINELIARAHSAPGSTEREQKRRREQPADDPWAASFENKILKTLRGLLNHAALTPWEKQFVGDVTRRYSHDYELSEKQLSVCQRIIRKCRFTANWG